MEMTPRSDAFMGNRKPILLNYVRNANSGNIH